MQAEAQKFTLGVYSGNLECSALPNPTWVAAVRVILVWKWPAKDFPHEQTAFELSETSTGKRMCRKPGMDAPVTFIDTWRGGLDEQ